MNIQALWVTVHFDHLEVLPEETLYKEYLVSLLRRPHLKACRLFLMEEEEKGVEKLRGTTKVEENARKVGVINIIHYIIH